MSKKSRKTAPRVALRADPRKSKPAATKRPAAAAKPAAEERIARALEAIASHLSAASPAAGAADSLGSADAFVWHPNGRLAPVPRVGTVGFSAFNLPFIFCSIPRRTDCHTAHPSRSRFSPRDAQASWELRQRTAFFQARCSRNAHMKFRPLKNVRMK